MRLAPCVHWSSRKLFLLVGPVGDLQHRKIIGVVPLGTLQDRVRSGEDGGLFGKGPFSRQ